MDKRAKLEPTAAATQQQQKTPPPLPFLFRPWASCHAFPCVEGLAPATTIAAYSMATARVEEELL